MRPKIAVALPARTTSEALKMIRMGCQFGADLAEIRLDYLKKNEPIDQIALKGRETPLIATFRSNNSGGRRRVKEKERIETLIAAADAGFDYVDVELETRNLKNVLETLRSKGAETIVSYHNFAEMPSDAKWRRILKLCRDSGATISKLTTETRRLEDSLRLLALTGNESKGVRLVCFGMGKPGIITRILSPIYGAAFTFASLDAKRTVAPGQISVSSLRRIYDAMGYA